MVATAPGFFSRRGSCRAKAASSSHSSVKIRSGLCKPFFDGSSSIHVQTTSLIKCDLSSPIPVQCNRALAELCANKDIAKPFSANAVVRLWECPDPFDEAPQASFVFDHRQALCTFTMGGFPLQSEPASLERVSAADEETALDAGSVRTQLGCRRARLSYFSTKCAQAALDMQQST